MVGQSMGGCALKKLFGTLLNLYLGIGGILALPPMISYIICGFIWPIQLMGQGHGFFSSLMAGGVASVVGLFSSFLRMLIWPLSVYLWATGAYGSGLEFFFPAFFNAPTISR